MIFFDCTRKFFIISDDGRNAPTPKNAKPDTSKPVTYQCLIRASSKNKKLATIVNQEDVEKFQAAYSQLLRANLDGLKKIKKQKNKSKATQ